tara:strand:+ start:540 stop:1799 length:1260 start_codon:yes stop_codon:yes gene_type:complete
MNTIKVDLNPNIIIPPIKKETSYTQTDTNKKLECVLDNNEYNKDFLLLNSIDKNKVIELGLRSFKLSNQTIIAWSDDEYQREIQKLKNDLKKEKNKTSQIKKEKQIEINELFSKMNNIKNEHQNELEEQRINIKQACLVLNKNEIDNKTILLNKADEKINELNKYMLDIQKKHNEEKENYKMLLENKYEEREKNLREESRIEREKLRNEKESLLLQELQKMNSKTEIASVKGKLGEQKLMDVLRDFRPNDEIIDTSSKGGSGDILHIDNNYTTMIEAKNYRTQMKNKEVDKFLKDLKTNKKYNAGIMASLYGHIPNKTNKKTPMLFEINDNKPTVYIGCLASNVNNIDFALWMNKNILNLNLTLSDAETINNIIKFNQKTIESLTILNNGFNKYEKSFKSNMEKIKKNSIEILNLLKKE